MATRQEYVLINGKVLDEADAKISVFDGSILYGYGVFETLRTYRGVFFAWEKHYQRLVKSCAAMNMKLPFTLEQGLYQLEQLRDTYIANGHEEDGAYRLTVSPGMIEDWRTDINNTVLITRRKIMSELPMRQKSGIEMVILETKRLPSITRERIKGTQFSDIVLARNELRLFSNAYGSDIADGFMFNQEGFLVEATCSNVFIVASQGKRPTLLTPSIAQEPLFGITRKFIMEIARDSGIEVVEAAIDVETLRQANEIFTTNSIQEVVPVNKVMLKTEVIFENSGPFTIANQLLQAYKNRIDRYDR